MTPDPHEPMPLTEPEILAQIESFDFIDVGANKGDSFRFGSEVLGGKRGLALDINPLAIANLRSMGIPALERDCTKFDFGDYKFRFAIFSHILEHMPDISTVVQLLIAAQRNVTDFLFVRQPFFDEGAYLSTLGLKTVGTNLTYHPLHVTSTQYASMLMNAGFQDFAIYGSQLLAHSHASKKIIRSDSPLQTKGWGRDKATKPEKFIFDRPVFRELAILVKISDIDMASIVEAALPDRRILYKSARMLMPIPD